ncbi:uncharacterized protein LOC134222958 [Armigeres subalbatus]|uniref:uncharacterized protein LOC134222958 n=1 Tax=Armigeres subalbatus TaxID=124917 RepID=UPI002ED157EF
MDGVQNCVKVSVEHSSSFKSCWGLRLSSLLFNIAPENEMRRAGVTAEIVNVAWWRGDDAVGRPECGSAAHPSNNVPDRVDYGECDKLEQWIYEYGRKSRILPVSSGKFDSGICPAEARDDTAPKISGPTSFQPDTSASCNLRLSDISLRIYYQNVRGLRTKIDDFFLSTTDSNYDAIVLTETWLDDRIYSAQLFNRQYEIFRNDRNRLNSYKLRGGGVLIAIWVKIKTQQRSVSVGVLYLPPDRKSDLNCIENHNNSIGTVFSKLSLNDFAQSNKPPSLDALRSSISDSCSTLLDGFSLRGLVQVNHVLNRNSRLLDFILVNEPALSECSVQEAVEPLLNIDADHPALETCINMPSPMQFETFDEVNSLDFRQANIVALKRKFDQMDWEPIRMATNVDEAVEYFTSVVNMAIVENVPLRRPPPKPAWANARLRKLKRFRSAALRKYIQNRNPFSKQLFTRASNEYRLYNRYLYRCYTKRIQNNLRLNPNQFWSFVRTTKNEDGLPTEIFLGERQAPSQVDLAILNTPRDLISLNIISVTPELVDSAIKKLKFSNSPGPDGFPSSLLKKCSSQLIHPLTTIFNLSLEQGVFPKGWKSSYMFPISWNNFTLCLFQST